MTSVAAAATSGRALSGQRGAALLTALLIVVLVSTLAAAMLWRQARTIQIESADRGRAQADWVLLGALDWAGLILREDARSDQAKSRQGKTASDDLTEVWAVPLAEARLSSFLATDANKSADSGPDAFLSGRIDDAQARYNLRNLIQAEPQRAAREFAIAARLFQSAGLSASLAQQLQSRLNSAFAAAGASDAKGNVSEASLIPENVDQLRWLDLSQEQVERLRPLVVILPEPTPVNLNTAPREVLAALTGMDTSVADALVRERQSNPFTSVDTVRTRYLGGRTGALPGDEASVTTKFFFVEGQLRMDDRVLIQRSLVQRDQLQVSVKSRQPLQTRTGSY